VETPDTGTFKRAQTEGTSFSGKRILKKNPSAAVRDRIQCAEGLKTCWKRQALWILDLFQRAAHKVIPGGGGLRPSNFPFRIEWADNIRRAVCKHRVVGCDGYGRPAVPVEDPSRLPPFG